MITVTERILSALALVVIAAAILAAAGSMFSTVSASPLEPAGRPVLDSGVGGEELTCTGSGEDHKCLYCIHHEGGTHCWWLKVPEPKQEAKQVLIPWIAERPGDAFNTRHLDDGQTVAPAVAGAAAFELAGGSAEKKEEERKARTLSDYAIQKES